MQKKLLILGLGVTLSVAAAVWFSWTTLAPSPLRLVPGALSTAGGHYRITYKAAVDSHQEDQDLVEQLNFSGQLDDQAEQQSDAAAKHLVHFRVSNLSWLANGAPVAPDEELERHFLGPHGFNWTAESEDLTIRSGAQGDDRVAKVVADSLNYLWLLQPASSQSTWQRSERDSAGRYQASYERTALDGGRTQIVKHWVTYFPAQSGLDLHVEPASAVRWVLAPDQRLQSVTVDLALSVHAPGLIGHAQVHLELELMQVASSAVAQNVPAAAFNAPGGDEAPEDEADSTEQLIKQVVQIRADSKAEDVYKTFRALKDRWRDYPHEIAAAAPVLKQLRGSDPAQRRQMSLLYGALAQTPAPEAVNVLTALLAQAPDEEARVQSAVALGNSLVPDANTLKTLWQAGSGPHGGMSRDAALLAYGSAAAKLVEVGSEAAPPLLSLAQTTTDNSLKATLLAAMGNHGAPEYLPYIQSAAVKGDDDQRATALYSARAYGAPEAVEWLTSTAVSDTSELVKKEAIKALTSQLNQRDNLEQLTRVALSAKNADTQLAVVQVLVASRGERPESATAQLNTLARTTTFPEVRAALSEQGAH